MDISVIWVPDARGAERLRAVHRRFAALAGAPAGAYPHITLGNYYGISFDALNAYARRFAARARPFRVTYRGLKLLNPSCLVLEAQNSGDIARLYDLFHRRYEAYADQWTKKETGLYLPHSTVLYLPGQDVGPFAQKADIEPFDVTVESMQLSRIYDGPRYEILSSFALGAA